MSNPTMRRPIVIAPKLEKLEATFFFFRANPALSLSLGSPKFSILARGIELADD